MDDSEDLNLNIVDTIGKDVRGSVNIKLATVRPAASAAHTGMQSEPIRSVD